MIVEEELGADPIRARVHLGLEMRHPLECVGRVGVTLGKSRNADPEGVSMSVTETLDVFDEIRCMIEVARLRITPILRRISPKGQDGGDSGLGIPREDLVDLVPGVSDAGEVGDCGDLRLLQQTDHEVVRPFSRGSAGAIGHRHE